MHVPRFPNFLKEYDPPLLYIYARTCLLMKLICVDFKKTYLQCKLTFYFLINYFSIILIIKTKLNDIYNINIL